MVKTGQFTTQCKDDNVICLKRQISFFASRLTEPIMAALTTEVTYVKSEMMRNSLHVVRPSTKAQQTCGKLYTAW